MKARQKYDNYAYTAHELIASVVEQLADIHKEAGRHFLEKDKDVAGSILGCAKYIHRLLNSSKWLYLIFTEASGLKFENYPKTLFNNSDEWKAFRQCGFGLNVLNKGDLTINAVQELLKTKFPMDIEILPDNGQKNEIVNNLLEKIFRFKKKIKYITKDNPESFYEFFDTFVSEVVRDYVKFREIEEEQLKKAFLLDRPPYTLLKELVELTKELEELEELDMYN